MFEYHLLPENYLLSVLGIDELKRRMEISEQKCIKAWNELRKIYAQNKSVVGRLSEAETESKIIEPILRDVLGFKFYRQPAGVGSIKPDFAVFCSDSSYNLSVTRAERRSIDFSYADGIVEAKYWNRPLLTKRGDSSRDSSESRLYNPSLQITGYLYRTQKTWGILTNGKVWRLFHKTDSAGDIKNYLGVDLQEILEAEEYEKFKIFYCLFSSAAFSRSTNGKQKLDQLHEEGRLYQEALGESLQENIFSTIPLWVKANSKRRTLDSLSVDGLNELYNEALWFHYRLLFILFAESKRNGRSLLPTENPRYYNTFSLSHLRDLIEKQHIDDFSDDSFEFQNRILKLFELVDRGSEDLNLSDISVPTYNGGLFRSIDRLAGHDLSDRTIAIILRELCFRQTNGNLKFIDFSNISVGHLGSIYEGLLQYKLKMADSDLTVIKKKGIETFEKIKAGKKSKVAVVAGEPYLATDKNERRASGSYFTPAEHVRRMVSETLIPQIDSLRDQNGKLSLEKILDLKVLDPAMGSGHFLVEAVELLAKSLLEAIDYEHQPMPASEDEEIIWAKREVVTRCIFGVDINPLAVELAKVSLWLTTVSRNEPLSFLDHHLKCGNSLLGEGFVSLFGSDSQQFDLSKFLTDQQRNRLIELYSELLQIPDSTAAMVHKKERLFLACESITAYSKKLFTASLLSKVGRIPKHSNFDSLVSNLAVPEGFAREFSEWIDQYTWIQSTHKPFHWELEFPNVFLFGERRGFDVIIGNPPYDVLEKSSDMPDELNGRIVEYRDLVKTNDTLMKFIHGKINLYVAFTGLSFGMLKAGGRFSFIIPLNILSAESNVALRRYIADNMTLEQIFAFPSKDDPNNRVFRAAKVSTAVAVIANSQNDQSNFGLEIFPRGTFDDPSTTATIGWAHVRQINRENLTIPLVSSDEWVVMRRLLSDPNISTVGDLASDIGRGEINQSSQKGAISKTPTEFYLWRGANIRPFTLVPYPKQGEVMFINSARLAKDFPSLISKSKTSRVVVQQNSGQDDSRRLTACLLPSEEILAESANYILLDSKVGSLVVGLLNSTLLDWYFRTISTTNHVTTDELSSLPFPNLDDSIIKRISESSNSKKKKASSDDAGDLWRTPPAEAIVRVSNLAKEILGRHDSIQEKLASVADKLSNVINESKESVWHQLDGLNKSNLSEVVHALSSGMTGSKRAVLKNRIEELAEFITSEKRAIKSCYDTLDTLVYRIYGLTNRDRTVVLRRLQSLAVNQRREQAAM